MFKHSKRRKIQQYKTEGNKHVPIKKTSTYIEGLDDILNGGIPTNRSTLIFGSPGNGKTVMGIEFIYRGALHGENGIYLSFEEPITVLRENALTMGWDLLQLENKGSLYLIEGRVESDAIISGKFSLKPLLTIISGKAKEIHAKRIVFDALDILFGLFENPLEVRAELFQLNSWLRKSGLTSIITLKPRESYPGNLFQDYFFSISDCVIFLDVKQLNQVSTRRCRIVKYRGSSFGSNEYPFVISDTGIRMIPITKFDLRHKPFGERLSSGVQKLDEMLGGGYQRSSCILFAGEPGTGKTLLASTFVRQVCKHGEKVLYLSFEESPDALIHNIKSAGINLDKYQKDKRLHLIGSMPEATGVEEHLLRLMDEVNTFKPQHVVIDAISACERIAGKQAAFDYLMRLLNFLKERGITVILTNQTQGLKSQMEISGNGISSMVDTLIYIKYISENKSTNRTIQVMKSRGSYHSNKTFGFRIKNTGLEIYET